MNENKEHNEREKAREMTDAEFTEAVEQTGAAIFEVMTRHRCMERERVSVGLSALSDNLAALLFANVVPAGHAEILEDFKAITLEKLGIVAKSGEKTE